LTFATMCLCVVGVVMAQGAKEPKPAVAASNKYIGAEKCKSCHQAEAAGNQYSAWLKTEHSKAWERLASDEAKASGKKVGIDEPQKNDKCLKCHTTAFGVAAESIKKGFDPKGGVQCESCHGPGEKHMKARFAAAASDTGADAGKGQPAAHTTIPADEIIAKIDEKTCLTCHNSESPNYKPFCFCEYFPKMRHLDPRKAGADKREFICSCDKCKAANGGQPGKCVFPVDPPK
jgi:hypothetical protein